VIQTPAGVPAAVQKVLEEIRVNGWDRGVMFEQNIPETVHLEVQVLRDRYGHTRHFGMRDCSEQRASQKIQEEAPPALLRRQPELEAHIEAIAVRIADACGYVGACTVELMYKDGHFYLLEMNTRIQVEHPVTEEAHRIRSGDTLLPLDLVRPQVEIPSGAAILDGTLMVSDLSAPNGTYELIRGNPISGAFDTVTLPAVGEWSWRIDGNSLLVTKGPVAVEPTTWSRVKAEFGE